MATGANLMGGTGMFYGTAATSSMSPLMTPWNQIGATPGYGASSMSPGKFGLFQIYNLQVKLF